MYLRTLLIVVVLGALALFAAMNWSAFTTPTTLALLFTTVEAPLGLILLVVIGVLSALFLIYLVYWQSSVLVENRRHTRELQVLREIADNAEASRLVQLRSAMETELSELGERSAEFKTAILARLDEIERDLRSTIEQSINALAAYIGEVEDRLEREAGGKISRP
jgi:uncharacterized integral membrane protein